MSVHAELSPSGSSRWMRCSGSVELTKVMTTIFGPEKSGPWAAAGTAAHELAERCLIEEVAPEHFLGQVIYVDPEIEDEEEAKHVVDDRMIEKIEPYVEFVRSLEGDKFYEQKVTLEPALPIYGTVDSIAARPKRLTITDLKTGRGQVDARGNTQLLIYALGTFKMLDFMYDFEEIELVISQPPIHHHDSIVITRGDLLDFAEQVRDAYIAVRDFPLVRTPSPEACQWCPARVLCPEMREEVNSFQIDALKERTTDQLSEALKTQVPMMKAYISGVENMSKDLALRGTKVAGFKSVEGRKSRFWKDPDATEKYLSKGVKAFRKVCFNTKLKSPAQMEKALKTAEFNRKVDISRFIDTKPGAPTLVPETDKRPEIKLEDAAAKDFEEFADG